MTDHTPEPWRVYDQIAQQLSDQIQAEMVRLWAENKQLIKALETIMDEMKDPDETNAFFEYIHRTAQAALAAVRGGAGDEDG